MHSPVTTSLLHLITVLQECTANDAEVVAMAAFLINTDRVRLCGTFAGARIDVSAARAPAPVLSLLPGRSARRDPIVTTPAVATRW